LSSFIAVAKLKSFAQAATVLYVSQPTRTAQIKKFKYALRLRLLGGRRRIERDRYRCRARPTESEYGAARRAGRGRWSAAA
jgi:DNA-binding transcriptional LysR family regulator